MNAQITGYLTVSDFVEMVKKKFNSDKSPAEIQDERVKKMGETQNQQAYSSQKRAPQQNEQNERYGVDIIV